MLRYIFYSCYSLVYLNKNKKIDFTFLKCFKLLFFCSRTNSTQSVLSKSWRSVNQQTSH